MTTLGYPLLVDSNQAFLSEVRNDPNFERLPPFICDTLESASRLLQSKRPPISSVFLSPSVIYGSGAVGHQSSSESARLSVKCVEFLKTIIVSEPLVQIQFLLEPNQEEPKYSELQFLKRRIDRPIKKPIDYSKLIEKQLALIESGLLNSRSSDETVIGDRHVTGEVKTPEAKSSSQVMELDSQFFALRADRYLMGSRALFDTYLRLGENKYVCLFVSHSRIDPTRVIELIKKGAKNFYFRKDSLEIQLQYCDLLLERLNANQKISAHIKVDQLSNFGELVGHFLTSRSVDSETINLGKKFCRSARGVADSLPIGNSPFLQAFLASAVALSHGLAATMVASLFLKHLNFSADKSIEIVGLACLFHDVALSHSDLGRCTEWTTSGFDRSKVTNEEFDRFTNHPAIGAALLSDIRGIHPSTIQAVAQHHELRDRSGFPEKIGGNHISKVAEIVSASEKLIEVIEFEQKNAGIEAVENPILEKLKFKSNVWYSPEVAEILLKIIGI